MSLRTLRGKGNTLSTFLDQIIPRQRFGSSVFNTPLLLLVRLWFQAAPLDNAIPPTPIRTTPVAPKRWPLSWLGSGYAARDTQWGTWCPSRLDSDDSNGITSKISTDSWRSRLQDDSYPISPASRLQSITWVHSLSSPLSHEYIQCIFTSSGVAPYRFIVERDTYGDWVYAVASSSPVGSASDAIAGTHQIRKVVKLLPDDEHHGSPLPLLSLSWSHLPESNRPTSEDLASVLENVTQRSPRYNILKEHCWWYAEAVFDEMLHIRRDWAGHVDTMHSQLALLKQWPWASYRYSYIVVGKKIFKRDVLLREAGKFREAMDQDGQLHW